MKVCVIGSGYVGLVSGTCLAEKGHEVTCVDVDAERVARIGRGSPPIHERGLEELLAAHAGGRLRATTDLRAAVLGSDLSLLAVGTPFQGDAIDLRYVCQAARQVGQALAEHAGYHVVVVKSTVVPGTTEDVVLPILEEASGRKAGRDFGVGMNPEFLREGEAVADFLQPDRIVLGGIDERTLQVMRQLYAVFPGVDVVETTPRTAETIKYAANSLLATLISFSNEIAGLCTALGGVDVADVTRGVHLDKRFSPILPDGTRVVPGSTTYVEAGCGFGGSCFPKDVKALIAHGRSAGARMEILESVIRVNERQPLEMIRMLEEEHPSLDGLRVTVLGLAFKPGTDDVRESPALTIVRTLCERGAAVTAHDPVARGEAEKELRGCRVAWRDGLSEALAGADAVLLVTSWPEYRDVPRLLDEASASPLVVDGRRMLDPASVRRYRGIGWRPAG